MLGLESYVGASDYLPKKIRRNGDEMRCEVLGGEMTRARGCNLRYEALNNKPRDYDVGCKFRVRPA